MTRVRVMNLVRQALLSVLLMTLAVSAARADWTYEYVDDFSTDKVQSDGYASSMFWTNDINPFVAGRDPRSHFGIIKRWAG